MNTLFYITLSVFGVVSAKNSLHYTADDAIDLVETFTHNKLYKDEEEKALRHGRSKRSKFVSGKNILRYTPENAAEHFEEFITTYSKKYDEGEKYMRYEIFLNNLEKINYLNENSDDAEYGITQFSDLTEEEFLIQHTGYRSMNVYDCELFNDEIEFRNTVAPNAYDWRTKGVVTPVKNQKLCGSCWAFSTTGNVESAYAIKTKKLVSLSEQQLVDCDVKSSGCNGGEPIDAIQYLQSNGAMTEADYPYKAQDGRCRYDDRKVRVHVTGCKAINVTEYRLSEKLYEIGPLSIALDALPLQHYTSGIIANGQCNGPCINHAVLLVGYGKSKHGYLYWTVKNSWSTYWGEHGYFRMQRGVNCLNFLYEPPVTAVV